MGYIPSDTHHESNKDGMISFLPQYISLVALYRFTACNPFFCHYSVKLHFQPQVLQANLALASGNIETPQQQWLSPSGFINPKHSIQRGEITYNPPPRIFLKSRMCNGIVYYTASLQSFCIKSLL